MDTRPRFWFYRERHYSDPMNIKTFALACLFVAPLALSQEADGPAELRTARATYLHQTKTATDPIKLQYSRTLESLKKAVGARGDVQGAVAIQREIDSLGLGQPNMPTLGLKEDAKLVIWNQNNGGKGDRGTKKVNVILKAGTKEIWRKNGVPVSWDKSKQEKETLSVPSAGVDTIRIEVTGLINDRGGLAEIEFTKDGKNLAMGCSVTTSAVWENNKGNAGQKLTDGSPDSFWLLPDRAEGWAEVRLK